MQAANTHREGEKECKREGEQLTRERGVDNGGFQVLNSGKNSKNSRKNTREDKFRNALFASYLHKAACICMCVCVRFA